MNKKIFRNICIAIIIFAIIFFLLIIGRKIYTKTESGLATINYEGTFKAKGVVVRPKKNMLVIMPTESNEEYRYQENFYYEANNQLNLKQNQEVEITFHYNKNLEEDYLYDAIIENVKILKEKSDMEVPKDIIVNAYSSKNNIDILIDKTNSNNRKIVFTITDKNEFKYNYSKMKYSISKYNPLPTKTEAIETENNASMSTSSYDPWPELPKINNTSTEANYTLETNGEVKVDIDWTNIYGELNEGEYSFTFSTVSTPRYSISNSNVIEYPYDSVIIKINFVIDKDGKIEYNEVEVQ